jgi:hypothetical protein
MHAAGHYRRDSPARRCILIRLFLVCTEFKLRYCHRNFHKRYVPVSSLDDGLSTIPSPIIGDHPRLAVT